MEFLGYRRPDGSVGVRNHVLLLPTVICSVQVCSRIAELVRGCVTLPHQHGCSQAAPDAGLTQAVLIGMGKNPNAGAVVVVSLGCEVVDGQAVTAAIAATGKPVEFIHIQDVGGSVAAIEAGARVARQFRRDLDRLERTAAPPGALRLGLKLGADLPAGDPLRAGAALAAAQVAGAGGTVLLARDAAGPAAVSGPLAYGAAPPAGGLWRMDTPGHDVEAVSGLVAGGAQVVFFATGHGTPVGNPLAPVLKVAAGPEALRRWADHIDLDAAAALAAGPEAGARAVLQALLAVAGGQEIANEVLGHAEFGIHRIALTL